MAGSHSRLGSHVFIFSFFIAKSLSKTINFNLKNVAYSLAFDAIKCNNKLQHFLTQPNSSMSSHLILIRSHLLVIEHELKCKMIFILLLIILIKFLVLFLLSYSPVYIILFNVIDFIWFLIKFFFLSFLLLHLSNQFDSISLSMIARLWFMKILEA